MFGGKSANFGELLTAGIPVPPGFAIGADAYRAFVEETGLARRRSRRRWRAPRRTTWTPHLCFEGDRRGDALRAVPGCAAGRVDQRYGELARSVGEASRRSPCGRARSARTALTRVTPASRRASSGCVGVEHVCDAVRDCWASLYTPQAISYRAAIAGGSRRRRWA